MDNILFLVSAHNSKDDRVFYHQAQTLVKAHYNVSICSFTEDRSETHEGINICSKYIKNLSTLNQIKHSQSTLNNLRPQVIICDTPLTVACSIIYKIKQ